ncbi:probable COP9 signalosome complex subunit 8 [Coccomyxa sp. Obi]|nr:probable COP9 signalosome complex subunit 8 [Coccomyxa sp. Obi]
MAVMSFNSPQLQSALSEGRYEDIAPQLDAEELQSSNPMVLTQDWPITVHLLGHIYNGKLEDARFLWKRAPEAVKEQDPELAAAFRLLQMTWNKDYQAIWPALGGHAWSPEASKLIAALHTKLRAHSLQLLSRSYSTISPAKAAVLLGASEAELQPLAEQEGWKLDPTTNMFKVEERVVEDAGYADLQHLERLSQYMVHLETGA